MAIIHEFRLPKETINTDASVRSMIASQAWEWYWANGDDVVLNISLLGIFRKKVVVRDLYGLWERVFGTDPTDVLGY